MNTQLPSRKQLRRTNILHFFAMVMLPLVAFSTGWVLSERAVLGAVERENRLHLTNTIEDQTTETPDEQSVNPLTQSQAERLEKINLSPLAETLTIIDKYYLRPSDLKSPEAEYGLIRGALSALDDPYTSFLTPEEYKEFSSDLDGELQGIGAELMIRDGAITIVAPIKGSPAETAGLQPNDVILGVDGEEAVAEDFFEVVDRIRGEAGSTVTLEIYRPKTAEVLEIDIIRAELQINTVELMIRDDNIAVIELRMFGVSTEQEFVAALEAALTAEVRGIVIDLRSNSGGLLDQAIHVLGAVLDKGTLAVIERERPPQVRKEYTVRTPLSTDIPLVVLINGGSASASEIVAGALQDHDRATIIGEQSFGKGTVQQLIPLRNGGQIKVTIAEWLTPDNRAIDGVGITPDLLVARTREQFEANEDPQLNAAISFLTGETLESLAAFYGTELPSETPAITEDTDTTSEAEVEENTPATDSTAQ